jgi:serine/threonine-protein kinase
MVGETIGHYNVLEKLGAGGMGEIYKAQDPRLNRFVAIKVLTAAGAGDPERRRRFTQEAQAASALNHPNIITIHDILSENETEYMVMEFVGGRTLADCIPREGLGVARTLQFGVQIADALRAAHAAGIVHRDLKPGNVMVTDAGLVKVLDFGLAKLNARPLSEETQTLNAAPMTVEGSILGTVSYMSPEQAQGRRVDARSDIFSFGVLLYEMVTGQKAFWADSTISTIASILRDEVKPISDLANGVPAEMEEVIGRALRKDPADRWQSMDEVFMVLAALKQKFDSGILTHTQILPPRPPSKVSKGDTQKKKVPMAAVAAAAAAAAVAAGGGAWWWSSHSRGRQESPKQQTEASIPAPAGVLPNPPQPEAPAPTTPAAPVNGALTNQDVVAMVKEKLSPSLIIGQIRASETKFDLSTAEVIRLAKDGVPERIIDAMRSPKAAPAMDRNTSATSKNPQSQAPVVTPAQVTTAAAPVTLPPPVAEPVSVAAPPTVTAPPPVVSSNSGAVTPTHPVNVLGGLPLGIILLADVPAGAEPGTPLRFQAAQDFRIAGNVVIAQGAPVTGELLGAGKKFLAIGGKVQFKLTSVTAVDGKKLKIKASPGRNGDKNEHSIEPGGNKNKDVLAPAGSQYMAYFDGDQTVMVKK